MQVRACLWLEREDGQRGSVNVLVEGVMCLCAKSGVKAGMYSMRERTA